MRAALLVRASVPADDAAIRILVPDGDPVARALHGVDALRHTVVAELNDVLVGVATAVVRPGGRIVLDVLHVPPAHRHRGIARALLASVVTWADEHDGSDLVVELDPSRREAHRYCARLGFSRQGDERVITLAALRRRLRIAPLPGRAASPESLAVTSRRRVQLGRLRPGRRTA